MIEEFLPLKDKYLLSLINNNYSMHTVDNYKRDLYIFELFLKSKGIIFLDLDKLLVDEYKGYLRTGKHLLDLDRILDDKIRKTQKKSGMSVKPTQRVRYGGTGSNGSRNGRSIRTGLSSRSVNRMLSALRSYIEFLVDLDKKVPLPSSAIKFIKSEKKEKQIAEFDELVELIEAPDKYELKTNIKYRNRAILELLFSTGMRISELVSLNREHVKIAEDGYTIKEPKIYIMGKGKKQRLVYLTHRSTSLLERYLRVREDEYAALFIPYRGTRRSSPTRGTVRISARYIQSIITRYKELIGIIVPTSPHSLRHGFATYLSEQGANPAAIQKLLGHESLQTTTKYIHASDKFAEQSHKKYHPLQ